MRKDRSSYTLKDALQEIALAEAILDGLGADEGKTLWGRIASVKKKLSVKMVHSAACQLRSGECSYGAAVESENK